MFQRLRKFLLLYSSVYMQILTHWLHMYNGEKTIDITLQLHNVLGLVVCNALSG